MQTDALPSPLLNPLEGPTMQSCEKLGLEGRSRLPALKGGRGACWKSRDQSRKRDQIIKLESASKTNHKKVSQHSGTPLGVGTSHGHFDTQDSPRPGFGGSHHLPPYSILCNSLPRLHPNGSFSWDSQVGIPKLSWVGVPRLWTVIDPRPELGLGRGLNQSCSSRPELSNVVSHSLRRRREEVDSPLLVVGSQTDSLTLGPSFAHNLGCKCPNGPCEVILVI